MRRIVSVVAAVFAVLAVVVPGLAQQYPSRVVTLIVP
jgi:tripartite-type tricarboxylate transporter receptor subunit TctC